MDLVTELEKLIDRLNDNQRRFVRHCNEAISQIDVSRIAHGSSLLLKDGLLEIRLIHALDPSTSLAIRVDKYEINVTCAGMDDSMFFQFPNSKDEVFYQNVNEYVKCALKGEFIKIVYSNSEGENVKGILKWRGGGFKESVFMSLGYKLKTIFIKEPLTKREFHYSSFLSVE